MLRTIFVLEIYFILIGCSSTKNTIVVNKTNQSTPTSVTQPKGWEKLPAIAQKDYLQIIPNDFVVVNESPVVALTQLLEYSGGGEQSKLKEFQVVKLENGQWKTIRYSKETAQSRFSNLETFNNELFMLFGWQLLQKYNGTDWQNVAGENTIGPPPAKKSYSYYPDLKFNKEGVAYTVWEDASYVDEGYLKGGSWLSCSRYEMGKWVWTGKRAFGKDCSRPCLGIGENRLYVLFKDYDEKIYEQNRSIFSMMVFEDGKWQYIGKRGFNPGAISGTSFDFVVNKGVPYVLFTYEDKWTGPIAERLNRIVLMKYTENEWKLVGDLQSTGDLFSLNLKFNKQGEPIVAYIDNYRKIRVRKYTGSVWQDFGELGTIPFDGPVMQNQWASSYQLRNLYFDLSETEVPYVVFTQTTRVRTKNQAGDRAFEQIFAYKFTGM